MIAVPFFKKRKKDPHQDLEQFVQGLQNAAQLNLRSIILFGSLSSGEFHDSHSDVNLLVFLKDASAPKLAALAPVLKSWEKKGHTLPIFLTPSEVPALAQALPIEFLDTVDYHRVLFGEDDIKTLSVDRRHLRAQCEQQLALLLLKVRQGVALAGGDQDKLRDLLIHSLPSVLTIYRAILRLQENVGKMTKIEAAERLGVLAGFDAAELRRLQEFRFSRKSDNVEDIAIHYIANIQKVTTYLQSR